MTMYRVRPGQRHGGLGEFGPGDLVELPPSVALAFADKLEPVSNPTPVPAEPAEPAGEHELPAAWLSFAELAKHVNVIRLLVANGYTTPAAVQTATDEDLLAIKGIGPKALRALRAVLGAD